MDYNPCFNTYNNISYRQRSQTLQPIRGGTIAELSNSKQFMLNKYFTSQMNSVDSERANYANVPPDADETLLIRPHQHQPHNPHPRPHQHVHNRSHSQHYYHTMCQVNDLNNYYNLSNIGTTIIPARSRHPSPINEPPPMHNHVTQLDSITIMVVCNELGILDSPPPMPNPRKYSVSGSRECGLYKIAFPQRRFVKGHFTDPNTGICLTPGSLVSVLGPSKDDRAKFTVCYNDQHIDMPHQLTCHPS